MSKDSDARECWKEVQMKKGTLKLNPNADQLKADFHNILQNDYVQKNLRECRRSA